MLKLILVFVCLLLVLKLYIEFQKINLLNYKSNLKLINYDLKKLSKKYRIINCNSKFYKEFEWKISYFFDTAEDHSLIRDFIIDLYFRCNNPDIVVVDLLLKEKYILYNKIDDNLKNEIDTLFKKLEREIFVFKLKSSLFLSMTYLLSQIIFYCISLYNKTISYNLKNKLRKNIINFNSIEKYRKTYI